MRNSFTQLLIFTCLVILLLDCESNNLAPTSSLVTIYAASPISEQNPTIGSFLLARFRLSYDNMKYIAADSNLKPNSIQTKTSLGGPDLIELNYYLSYGIYGIDSTKVPNGSYKNLQFKILPCQWPEVIQGMKGKTVLFSGWIDNSEFEFWHDGTADIKTYLPDSLLTIARGVPVTLELYVDLNKVLDPKYGGVDLSTAKDGNQDGIFSIDPTNEDGNAELANTIFTSVVKNISCKKK